MEEASGLGRASKCRRGYQKGKDVTMDGEVKERGRWRGQESEWRHVE